MQSAQEVLFNVTAFSSNGSKRRDDSSTKWHDDAAC